jgi:hypothetical protein
MFIVEFLLRILKKCLVYLYPPLCVQTLQRKFHLRIPFRGIARPQSQFPHSCAFGRFINSQSTYVQYLAAAQLDRPILEIYKYFTEI